MANIIRLRIDEDVPIPPRDNPTPFSDEESHAKFISYVTAAAGTVELLEQHGLDGSPSRAELDLAATIAIGYAEDPMSTAKKHNTIQKVSNIPPLALRETHTILHQFGHSIVKDAVQVRHLVTNKLIAETENPDPRVRMKALELLGKISDVGLFSEKSEITITHQTSDDLKDLLKSKLQKLVDAGVDVVDAEVVEGGDVRGGTLDGEFTPEPSEDNDVEPDVDSVDIYDGDTYDGNGDPGRTSAGDNKVPPSHTGDYASTGTAADAVPSSYDSTSECQDGPFPMDEEVFLDISDTPDWDGETLGDDTDK